MENRTPSKIIFKTINKELTKQNFSLGNYENLQFSIPDSTEQIWLKDSFMFKQTIKNIKSSLQEQDFQIVCDFDFTMSKFEYNGYHTDTSFGIFEQEGTSITSQKFKEKMKGLFNHYWPIEMDPLLKEEEKAKLIAEWYSKTEDAYIEEKITKKQALSLLNTANLVLRNGVDRFLYQCKDINLPFYLISGGVNNIISTIIERILPNYIEQYPNLFIFSNLLEFANNETEEINKVDIQIQSLNKDQVLINPQIERKKYTILIGDSLSDLSIIKNIKFNEYELLKIGFFNGQNLNDENKINKYKECFDVLIIGDGNFTFLEIIMKYLLDSIDDKNEFWLKYKQYFE